MAESAQSDSIGDDVRGVPAGILANFLDKNNMPGENPDFHAPDKYLLNRLGFGPIRNPKPKEASMIGGDSFVYGFYRVEDGGLLRRLRLESSEDGKVAVARRLKSEPVVIAWAARDKMLPFITSATALNFGATDAQGNILRHEYFEASALPLPSSLHEGSPYFA